MARTPKAADNLQVFRGSLSKPDVFAQNANDGCCPSTVDVTYDKLGERVRFDNALAHLNPIGANEKFNVPTGNGFSADYRRAIVDHINAFGVGATISVIAIPTYAFVTGVNVHIAAEEPGLTFNLITRNGLVLPTTAVHVVEAAGSVEGCSIDRTDTAGDETSFAGFGALDGNLFIDIFGRSGESEFSLEADELILEVATIPTDPVSGLFRIEVAVSYEIINRAER